MEIAMDEMTQAAFERLLDLARSDTGQSRRAADFILAWWNASELGGFDLADVFAVDMAIGHDMARVFAWLASLTSAEYPEAYEADIKEIIRLWRPEVWARSIEAA